MTYPPKRSGLSSTLEEPANYSRAVTLYPKRFHYAFTHTLTAEAGEAVFERYAVPGPGARPLPTSLRELPSRTHQHGSTSTRRPARRHCCRSEAAETKLYRPRSRSAASRPRKSRSRGCSPPRRQLACNRRAHRRATRRQPRVCLATGPRGARLLEGVSRPR
jgi:hypothetical protein